MSGRVLAAVMAAGLLALAACGSGDDDDQRSADRAPDGMSSDGGQTIDIEMRDNEFSPSAIEVPAGEEVRLVFRNRGEVTHDAVVGDQAAQAEHEQEMRAAEAEGAGDMHDMGEGETTEGMSHDDSTGEGGITVEPGETGEITHAFQAGDEVLVGCHQAGHYEAGMKITVGVS